jgi:hypothetical protein
MGCVGFAADTAVTDSFFTLQHEIASNPAAFLTRDQLGLAMLI